MYYHPFWLITGNDVRNASIADALQEEFDELKQQKSTFYSSLPESAALFKLLEIDTCMFKILSTLLKANLNILNSRLDSIDVYRSTQKIKRTLGACRVACNTQVHEFDVFSFIDTLHQPSKWEDFSSSEIRDLGDNFLTRIGTAHQHYESFTSFIELILLTGSEVNYDIDHFVTGAYSLLRDVADYAKIINSL